MARPGADGVTAAVRVREVLQHLADAAADLEGRARRPVPVLADRALADQLVVLVDDVLACLPKEDSSGKEGGAALVDVHARLVALRRSL